MFISILYLNVHSDWYSIVSVIQARIFPSAEFNSSPDFSVYSFLPRYPGIKVLTRDSVRKVNRQYTY